MSDGPEYRRFMQSEEMYRLALERDLGWLWMSLWDVRKSSGNFFFN